MEFNEDTWKMEPKQTEGPSAMGLVACEHKAVYLEWLDHASLAEIGWKDPAIVKAMEPTLIHSLGWVLNETDDYITIVGTLSADSDEVDGDVCIVKSCIVRREEVSFA